MTDPKPDSGGKAFAGFPFSDFPLLASLLPVTAATTPEELELRAAKALPPVDLLDFRRRVGRGTVGETTRRLAGLCLRLSAAQILVGDDDRILLPVEAWPVAVDLSALKGEDARGFPCAGGEPSGGSTRARTLRRAACGPLARAAP